MSLFPQGFKFWHAIEPDTRRITLAEAGELRLGDPLFLLTQQWRMGEFRHLQGGLPIRAEVDIAESPLLAISDKDGTTEPVAPGSRSEEVLAEPPAHARELAPDRAGYRLGLSVRRRMEKALSLNAGLGPAWRSIEERFAAGEDSRDRILRLRAKAGAGGLDGSALFAAIRDRDRVLTESPLWPALVDWFLAEGGSLRNSRPFRPADPGSWADRIAEDSFLRDRFSPWRDTVPFPDRFDRDGWPFPVRDSRPRPGETRAAPEADLFEPATFAHTGNVTFGRPEDNVSLNLTGSYDGTLDWTAFDDEMGQPGTPSRMDWVVPTRLSFPGKPEERLWTLADSAADWTAASAGPSDLARMVLGTLIAEQSADWTIIPVTVMRGALVQITNLRLATGFGITTTPRPAPFDHLRLWSALRDQPADVVLTLTEPQPLEGPAVERCTLRPDDHANLLWLIERRLPDGDGRGKEANERRAPFPDVEQPVYHLQTDPGENWYPFAHSAGEPFRPKPFATTSGRTKTPAGRIGASIDAVEQGLVPFEGLSIERLWRSGRDHTGLPVRWIARRRTRASEPASSGLIYDHLVRPGRK